MPTLPPRAAGQIESEIHRHRQLAESFGLDPERYDRARPRYPGAMIEAIVAASPGPDVLDVGCGTGIAARQFQAAGCRVLGVDIDERMGAFARRRGLAVEVAKFEAWDSAGREFDAVIAGQTWHWVEPVAGARRAAQVLRPGGRLALFWNMFQPAPEVAEGLAAVYRRVMPDLPFRPWASPTPDAASAFFTRPADGIRSAGAFSAPNQWRFEWERRYTRAEWLDQLPTAGGHGRLPPAQLDALLAGTGAAIDALGGSFTMRYDTVVITAALAAR
ncbi:MAG TPA: class I SAM-dependent methyltransferase [Solirubrobacteraceae bacterium]|nr:class I SAM-dependent methyltransferase [Solirubrobacteraceae bacterium]